MAKTIPFGSTPIAQPKTIPFGTSTKTEPAAVTSFPKEEPPAVKRSFMQALLDPLKTGAHNFGQAATGFAKGAANTVSESSSLIQNGLNIAANPIVKGFTGSPVQTPTIAESIPQNVVTPSNTMQKVGFGAEKVGEFLIPGGAETDIGNAAGKVLENAPKIVQAGGKLVAKALTSATINSGITAAQGGSGKDIKTAGVVGAIASPISEGVSSIIKSLPENAWANILKRTSSQVAKNPDLPAQAAETGIIGTKQGIRDIAQTNIQTLETHLSDLLKGNKGKVDGNVVAHYLDDLKNTYQNVPGESYSANIIGTLQQEMRDKGTLSVAEANQLKRDIYGIIEKSYGKGTLEIPANSAGQKALASGIKQEIEKVVPGVKDVNQKMGVYIQIRKALDRQLSLGEGRGIAGLHIGGYDLLTGGMFEAAGLASGHPLAGVAAIAGKKAIESPITQSVAAKFANYFNNLSPTQKALFYNGIKGLTTKTVNKVTSNP